MAPTKKFSVAPCNFSLAIHNGLNKILDVAKHFDVFVIGGDLNAKNPAWGDQFDNSNGRAVHSWMQDNILEVVRVSDNSPSFPNGSSFLDHFLIDVNLINMNPHNFNVSSLSTFSDHFPIKFQLHLNNFDLVLRCPNFFTSFKNTNWDHFVIWRFQHLA